MNNVVRTTASLLLTVHIFLYLHTGPELRENTVLPSLSPHMQQQLWSSTFVTHEYKLILQMDQNSNQTQQELPVAIIMLYVTAEVSPHT